MIATNGFLAALTFTKFVFGRPGPHWRSLQRSPDPLAGLRGPISKGEGKGREEGERKVTGETVPFEDSWIRPWGWSTHRGGQYELKRENKPYQTYTTFQLVRFKPRFSAVLLFCRGGRQRLSRGRSLKVYVLIAVNAVPSRSSRRYICGFLRFSAVLASGKVVLAAKPKQCSTTFWPITDKIEYSATCCCRTSAWVVTASVALNTPISIICIASRDNEAV